MSAARDASRNANRIVGTIVDRLGRKLGAEGLRGVIDRTPKLSGHASANWNVSIGRPDGTVRSTTNTRAAFADGLRKLRGFNLSKGEKLFISNGVVYIQKLEDGSSGQAPQGMIRLTVQDLKQFAERAVRRLRV